MSTAVDRPGTFRGKLTEWGVSESKGGFPQFVAKLLALEYYDEEKGEYVPWVEYDQELPAYLILFTKKNEAWVECLNVAQIKKALGWDGQSFESLANGQYGETIVLFRVEPNEYNGQTTLQVKWIDTADANPVKTLPKYDADKLKGLTAKLGSALQSAVPTPAKAPVPASARPAVPPKGKPGPKPRVAGPMHGPCKACQGSGLNSKGETCPICRPKPAVPSTATPPPASPAPAPAVPSAPSTPISTPAPKPETKDSAWTAVNELKGADVTDEKLAEVWIAEATKIGKPEDQFTADDWHTVKEAVHAVTSKF